jgi:hypothetical protein
MRLLEFGATLGGWSYKVESELLQFGDALIGKSLEPRPSMKML